MLYLLLLVGLVIWDRACWRIMETLLENVFIPVTNRAKLHHSGNGFDGTVWFSTMDSSPHFFLYSCSSHWEYAKLFGFMKLKPCPATQTPKYTLLHKTKLLHLRNYTDCVLKVYSVLHICVYLLFKLFYCRTILNLSLHRHLLAFVVKVQNRHVLMYLCDV